MCATTDREPASGRQRATRGIMRRNINKAAIPVTFRVIDHGHSEFSMIAHFEAHSILVKIGDHVRQVSC